MHYSHVFVYVTSKAFLGAPVAAAAVVVEDVEDVAVAVLEVEEDVEEADGDWLEKDYSKQD